MKNSFVFTACLVGFLISISGNLKAQSNPFIIGEVKNGVASITDQANASTLLRTNLAPTAVLSDVKLEFSEFDGTYYLTARVANDKVSSIGVQLGQSNAALYSGPGVGVEVTCTGRNCTDCRLIISKWRPKCKCEEYTSSDFACDMTQKAVINIGGL